MDGIKEIANAANEVLKKYDSLPGFLSEYVFHPGHAQWMVKALGRLSRAIDELEKRIIELEKDKNGSYKK